MSAAAQVGLTVADLDPLPEEEGVIRELIGGVLYVRGRPALRHQEVILAIGSELRAYAKAQGGQAWVEPGNVLTDVDAVAPDVAYVRAERLAGMDPAHLDRAADLVVEVSSAGTRRIDLGPKRDLYERVGVPEYWFVDLDLVDLDAGLILVHRLGADGRYGVPVPHGADTTITPPHLPGLATAVADVLG